VCHRHRNMTISRPRACRSRIHREQSSDQGKVLMRIGSHKTLAAFHVLVAFAVMLGLSIQPRDPLPAAGRTANGNLTGALTFPLSTRGRTAAVLTTGTFAPPAAPALGLVMADFTGDTQPDLATVELDRLDSSAAHYWIEIRLTEGGHQFLRLAAPFGGLQITPQDLTGDGNLDLIVRSASSKAALAVFLNDGSGHFSRADVAAFASTLPGVMSPSALGAQQIYQGITFACLESYAAECSTGSFRHLRQRQGPLLSPNPGAASQRVLSFAANRAPPSLA